MKIFLTMLYSILCCLFVKTAFAQTKCARVYVNFEANQWLTESTNFSLKNLPQLMQSNGAVRAASDARYGYYWVRDGAYVYSAYLKANGKSAWNQMRAYREMTLKNQTEPTYSLTENGEPYHNFQAKFNLDGTSYSDWMAQGDGPGLRATTLTEFAYALLQEGLTQNKPELVNEVRNTLYDGKYAASAQLPIERDLSSLGLKNKFGDIMAIATNGEAWEEKWGRNLSNKLENRTALLLGSILAQNENLSRTNAANYFLELAGITKVELEKHWDSQRKYLVVTLPDDPNRGEDPNSRNYKVSQLDSQVILSATQVSKVYIEFSDLFSAHPDVFAKDQERLTALSGEFEYMGVTDPKMRRTYLALKTSFAEIYPINNDSKADPQIVPAWGRYPEDHYSGDGSDKENGGNPWVITTQGAAMFQALNAIISIKKGFIKIADDGSDLSYFADLSPQVKEAIANGHVTAGQIIYKGDSLFNTIILAWKDNMFAYIDRIKRHTYQKTKSDGSPDPEYLHMSEQIDRNSGHMTSVKNLGWNYAYQIELKALVDELAAIF